MHVTPPTDFGSPGSAGPRRLLAVVHVDMVGYSRLIGADDIGTLNRFRLLREQVIDPAIAKHQGHLHQTAGDSLLVTFDSITQAVACAVGMQHAIPAAQRDWPPEQVMRFRVGVDLGDIIADGNDLHGNAVNVAVRLQTACPAGDVCISGIVHHHVRDRLDCPVLPLGPLTLKNIEAPVEVFVLQVNATQAPAESGGSVLTTPAATTMAIGVPGARAFRSRGPSIAVLPFATLSRQKRDAYFAEGIAEDIVHTLAGIKDLFVISRGSTLRYSGRVVDFREVSQELSVQYVLHGSVRRSAQRIKVRTELTDATDLRVIRSDQYEVALSDIFSIQERIATEVALAIEPQVRAHELRQAMRKPPNSLTAYDLLLKALDALFRVTYEPLQEARRLLMQAIAIDPDYAPAYTYLAYAYILHVGEGWTKDPVADASQAEEFANQAIMREPKDPVALAIYGHVQSFLNHDYDRAKEFLDRALEAGPSCALAWTMSSFTRGYLGEARLAVEHAERGLQHSPLDPRIFWSEAALGQAYYVMGEYALAVEWTRKSLAHCPTAVFNMRTLAASLVAAGQLEEAHRAAERLLRVQADFRLSAYRTRCPFQEPILATWIDRLRQAGLPE